MSEAADDVFAYWKSTMDKKRAILDAKRRRAIDTRLRDGWTVAELKKAVDGCRLSSFHQGDNERGKKYNDIELICRDSSHVERFLEEAERMPMKPVCFLPPLAPYLPPSPPGPAGATLQSEAPRVVVGSPDDPRLG